MTVDTIKIAEWVRSIHARHDSAHDFAHVERVRATAVRLARAAKGADEKIVELAALLHDVCDNKNGGGNPALVLPPLLLENGASQRIVDAVVAIVENMSFRDELQKKKESGKSVWLDSVEFACVQDADRLDALGAVGIARCFAFGGSRGQPLHTPDEPALKDMTAEQYQARTGRGSSINHFHEKLFTLKDRMKTEEGRRIACQRHAFMLQFVERFLSEWDGTDFIDADENLADD